MQATPPSTPHPPHDTTPSAQCHPHCTPQHPSPHAEPCRFTPHVTPLRGLPIRPIKTSLHLVSRPKGAPLEEKRQLALPPVRRQKIWLDGVVGDCVMARKRKFRREVLSNGDDVVLDGGVVGQAKACSRQDMAAVRKEMFLIAVERLKREKKEAVKVCVEPVSVGGEFKPTEM